MLDGAGHAVAETRRWLVLFRVIDRWSGLRTEACLPPALAGRMAAAAGALRARQGRGMLFGFVQDTGEEMHTDLPDRLRTAVTGVDWLAWDSQHGITRLPSL